MGHRQRRHRNRRDHHENGRRPRHRPHRFATRARRFCRRTIPPRCTTGWRRLGAELLVQTIPDFVAGKIQPEPQPAEGASYAAKIKKEDGRIDWNQPAQTIWNRLRAFTPWPGAFTFLKAEPKPQLLKIWKAEVVGKIGRSRGDIVSGQNRHCRRLRTKCAADFGIAARRRTAPDGGGISGGPSAEHRRPIRLEPFQKRCSRRR